MSKFVSVQLGLLYKLCHANKYQSGRGNSIYKTKISQCNTELTLIIIVYGTRRN